MLSTSQDAAADLFKQGSGLNSDFIAMTFQIIGISVAVVIFAWLVLGIFSAYKDNQLKHGEAVWSALKAAAVLCFIAYVLLS